MVGIDVVENAIRKNEVDSLPWSSWRGMPSPENCKSINGPENSGVYQIREIQNKKNIQFGIGKNCQERMKSLFPKPHGTGTRNNEFKRKHILDNWRVLEYRTLATENRIVAKLVEDFLKGKKDHLFNT
jgi:hypothetical protein